MATTTRAGELLSPDFLAQLERLALLSRRAFRGRVKGERRSPRKGISVEFSDYRPYGIGDDLRYVDWNIYGRLDRLYVKLFVDEEDLCLNILLDASASMAFGSPSKLAYGTRLAAGLGFVGLVNLERVGVAVVRERLAEGVGPARGRSQILPLMDFLSRVRPAAHLPERGAGSLGPAHPRGGTGRRHLGPHGSRRLRARAAEPARAPPRPARDPPPRRRGDESGLGG